MDSACTHQLAAGNIIRLPELTAYPNVTQRCRKCDVNWSQPGIRNQAVDKNRNLFRSFHNQCWASRYLDGQVRGKD
jgi:hypothetical protein